VPRVARDIDPRAKQTPHIVTNLAGASPVLFRYRPHTRTITNAVGMTFARVPAGSFIMGAPKEQLGFQGNETQHNVSITRPHYLGAFEVTQKQYRAIMKASPSAFAKGAPNALSVEGIDTDDLPVEQVTWDQAVEFCERMSSIPDEKKAGRRYRLPTEEEWEYACRAGTTTAFHFGKSLTHALANFGRHVGHPCPVGRHPPNAFGLHDMHGQVWEKCVLVPVDEGETDEVLAECLRGGSYNDGATGCRSAFRTHEGYVETSDDDVGFRVVMEARLRR